MRFGFPSTTDLDIRTPILVVAFAPHPSLIAPLFVLSRIAPVHIFCSIIPDPSYRVRYAIYTRFR